MTEYFNIKHMMTTLKIKDWKNIVPFRFYLDPLEKAYITMRQELLEMEHRGHLLIKYHIPQNKKLMDLTKVMLLKDRDA
jgi:hypothetical protein